MTIAPSSPLAATPAGLHWGQFRYLQMFVSANLSSCIYAGAKPGWAYDGPQRTKMMVRLTLGCGLGLGAYR